MCDPRPAHGLWLWIWVSALGEREVGGGLLSVFGVPSLGQAFAASRRWGGTEIDAGRSFASCCDLMGQMSVRPASGCF